MFTDKGLEESLRMGKTKKKINVDSPGHSINIYGLHTACHTRLPSALTKYLRKLKRRDTFWLEVSGAPVHAPRRHHSGPGVKHHSGQERKRDRKGWALHTLSKPGL